MKQTPVTNSVEVVKRVTASEIISDALSAQYESQRMSRLSGLERLLDFTEWGSRWQQKLDRNLILYLSNRVVESENSKRDAELAAYNAKKIAAKCVEIYGSEAMFRFEEMWQHFSTRFTAEVELARYAKGD